MILVTADTGHVGRAVVSRLASLGHDAVAMVRVVHAASRRLPLESPCASRTMRMPQL